VTALRGGEFDLLTFVRKKRHRGEEKMSLTRARVFSSNGVRGRCNSEFDIITVSSFATRTSEPDFALTVLCRMR
jgi:hypothetical protein